MAFGSVTYGMARVTPAGTLTSRSCPKCQGNMALEFDSRAGYYKSCINCGRIEYLRRPAPERDQSYRR